MYTSLSRRRFVQNAGAVAALGATGGWNLPAAAGEPLFQISLAHWSYHKAIFGNSRSDWLWFIKTLHSDPDAVLLGHMDPRDLAVRAREHGIDAVDYSNGAWLTMVVESVNHPRLGVLADFGNWFLGGWNNDPPRWYDRYQGLRDVASYTRSVSAKSHGFDERGQEIQTDFSEAMRILLEAGFRGYASVEYEGNDMSEDEGVAATKRLLESVREELALSFK